MSYDLELLFEEQVNIMSNIMECSLRTVKGKDLVRRHPNDPVQLWKQLMFHHKGSDASTDAASKLLKRLTDIQVSHFPLKLLFLHEFATIIDYYNDTNTAVLDNSMKLQYLRLAVMQDKDLQGLYTSYLASMRTAGGVVNHNYTVDYAEFFEVIKQHAELLDSTNTRQRSNSSR